VQLYELAQVRGYRADEDSVFKDIYTSMMDKNVDTVSKHVYKTTSDSDDHQAPGQDLFDLFEDFFGDFNPAISISKIPKLDDDEENATVAEEAAEEETVVSAPPLEPVEGQQKLTTEEERIDETTVVKGDGVSDIAGNNDESLSSLEVAVQDPGAPPVEPTAEEAAAEQVKEYFKNKLKDIDDFEGQTKDIDDFERQTKERQMIDNYIRTDLINKKNDDYKKIQIILYYFIGTLDPNERNKKKDTIKGKMLELMTLAYNNIEDKELTDLTVKLLIAIPKTHKKRVNVFDGLLN
jgi:hypothetical protein